LHFALDIENDEFGLDFPLVLIKPNPIQKLQLPS
jgi:hypothetical protein